MKIEAAKNVKFDFENATGANLLRQSNFEPIFFSSIHIQLVVGESSSYTMKSCTLTAAAVSIINSQIVLNRTGPKMSLSCSLFGIHAVHCENAEQRDESTFDRAGKLNPIANAVTAIATRRRRETMKTKFRAENAFRNHA